MKSTTRWGASRVLRVSHIASVSECDGGAVSRRNCQPGLAIPALPFGLDGRFGSAGAETVRHSHAVRRGARHWTS